MSEPADFQSLFREITSDDPGRRGAAVDRLIVGLVPKVEALARRRFYVIQRPVESSRDLASEVLLDLGLRLRDGAAGLSFESESKLMVYIDRMMRNRQASKARRPRLPIAPTREREGDQAAPEPPSREPRPSFPAREAERREQLQSLRTELFRQLGREEYRLIYRRFFQGLNYRQIADRLPDQPSAQAVGNRIARLLERLVPVLSEFQGCLDPEQPASRRAPGVPE